MVKSAFVVLIFFVIASLAGDVRAEVLLSENTGSRFEDLREKAKKGSTDPITGSRLYWTRGLHWESAKKNLILKVGGKFAVDTGNIDADDELGTAFPDLEGYQTDFRFASVTASGRIYNFIEYRLEVDLATTREIKDNWVRFKKIPYLGFLQTGHLKEPFSLEREGSFNHLTFMENSLPTQALSAGRNMGVMLYNMAFNDRLTWKVGGFLNTGSFTNVGNPQDRISDANGYNITARITGRPWHTPDGRRLLHLGLSYSLTNALGSAHALKAG